MSVTMSEIKTRGETMSGALQLRLEQQRHWELALSVQDGRQSSLDPDQHRLTELRRGERVYDGLSGPFYKRLVAGAWQVLNESDLYYD
jgi:hypothetical protein